MRIFVSYTIRDGILDATALSGIERRLGEIGNPYIDLLHNKSSHPQHHVIQMLNQSAILCACITPASYTSKWFRLEINLAARQGKPIIELTFINGDLDLVNWQAVKKYILNVNSNRNL